MITISTLLLCWCFRQVNLTTFWQELYQFHILTLATAIFVLFVSLFIKSFQWELFIPKKKTLPYKHLFEVVAVMFMMANTIPWGQAFTIYHLGHIRKVGKVIAVSVMTLDQVATAFSRLALLIGIALIAPIPAWIRNSIFFTVILIISICLFLIYFAHKHRDFQESDDHINYFNLKSLSYHFSKWAHNLHILRDYKKTIISFLLAVSVKLCEAAAIFLVQKSFGLNLPLWTAFLIMISINFATMISITPGNIGVFEFTAFYIYKSLGIDPNQAMILALFHHLVYLIPMVIPGYIIAVRQGIKMSHAFIKQKKLKALSNSQIELG